MDLIDKVAIVTGAGRGIGRAIAAVLAQRGATVVVTDVTVEGAQAVAAEITTDGYKAEAVRLNVTDRKSVDAIANDVAQRHGRIDILVNNAAVVGAPGWELRDLENEADWDLIYEVNVKGVAWTTDAVAAYMKSRRYGKIVNIASMAGRRGGPFTVPYNISKAGVLRYTQGAALELAPYNINVNAICPAQVWTPMAERIAGHLHGSSAEDPREQFLSRARDTVPLGREQTPEDIGYLTAFLASDYARNITGQAINVNGGSFMN